MTLRDYVVAHLAVFCWRESRKFGGYLHGKAIAHCMANRVRAGMHGGEWLKVIEAAPQLAYNNLEDMDRQSLPDFYDRDFEAIRRECEDIYDGYRAGKMVTSVAAHGFGGKPKDPGVPCLYYADLANVTRAWFRDRILAHPEEHRRLVEVQPLIFFS